MTTGATGFALTTAGDLDLTAKRRDLVWISGIDAIAQMASCRLKLLTGEWLTDETAGLNWSRVVGTGVTRSQIESEIRRVLASVPGIAFVVSVTVDINAGTRLASVDWQARGDTGALIAGTEVI